MCPPRQVAKDLSRAGGNGRSERITWRYDPVYHRRHRGALPSRSIRPAGRAAARQQLPVAVSFFDDYRGALARLKRGGVREPNPAGEELAALAQEMVFSPGKLYRLQLRRETGPHPLWHLPGKLHRSALAEPAIWPPAAGSQGSGTAPFMPLRAQQGYRPLWQLPARLPLLLCRREPALRPPFPDNAAGGNVHCLIFTQWT